MQLGALKVRTTEGQQRRRAGKIARRHAAHPLAKVLALSGAEPKPRERRSRLSFRDLRDRLFAKLSLKAAVAAKAKADAIVK